MKYTFKHIWLIIGFVISACCQIIGQEINALPTSHLDTLKKRYSFDKSTLKMNDLLNYLQKLISSGRITLEEAEKHLNYCIQETEANQQLQSYALPLMQ
ncbi:MAG: hypothetical protein NZ551_11260 [Microscillaceae bacterium]|nr:hypothetical protein [Microscillaceae bacterium]MDW8461775.1 hypothetical protein [Cytophagales bacterium]